MLIKKRTDFETAAEISKQMDAGLPTPACEYLTGKSRSVFVISNTVAMIKRRGRFAHEFCIVLSAIAIRGPLENGHMFVFWSLTRRSLSPSNPL